MARMWKRTTKRARTTKIKAFDLCSKLKTWISKTGEQFLYSLTCTSAYFKSDALITPSCLCDGEQDSPPLLMGFARVRSGLPPPAPLHATADQCSSYPLDPKLHIYYQVGIIWEYNNCYTKAFKSTDQSESLGSDLAVFSGLDAAVGKEWEKDKRTQGTEARKCANEGGVKPEATDRALKHQKFILVLWRSRLANKKRLERSP